MLDASGEVVVPRLLAMLSVVAVFVPSFFMTGVSRSLFVPLSLAVGFAMIASFLLSSSLVPVLSVWLLRTRVDRAGGRRRTADWVERLARSPRTRCCSGWRRRGGCSSPPTSSSPSAIVVAVGLTLGREIFPPSGVEPVPAAVPRAGRHEVRVDRAARRATCSTRSRDAAGPDNVDITLGYVGVQPSSYPINTIFLWTGGSHEGVLQVALKPERRHSARRDFEETLRRRFREQFPDAQFSFEPGDIVSRIMNFGAPTPVEVAVDGPGLRRRAGRSPRRCGTSWRGFPTLRDLQYGQALDYPAIQVDVNRQMAGQLGVTVDQVGRSFAAATSSSRFVAPNYWADPRTGIAFQVQVEVPQPRMTTLEDLRVVPVSAERGSHAAARRRGATIENATIVGEYDRINGQRMVTLTANVAGRGSRARRRPGRSGDRARGRRRRAARPWRCAARSRAMRETFTNITAGLVVAVVVIFLLLAANFQSLRLAFVVVSTVPAVLAGVVLMLGVDADDAERAVVHGRDHGDRRRRRERDPAGDVCRAVARGRARRRCRPPSTRRAPACGRC